MSRSSRSGAGAGRAGEDLLRALVRSARSDAPRPGAKARALARLVEAQGRGVSGALAAAAVVLVMLSGFVGSSSAPRVAVSPPECHVGVEAPPGACVETYGESGGASGALGSSSGVTDPSGSSSG